jgi:hypothetical protein
MKHIFTARLIFKISIGETDKRSYEEQIRIYYGPSESNILIQACRAGNAEEITLPQKDHGFVKWSFLGVAEIIGLSSLEQGAILDTRIIEPSLDPEYETYILRKISRTRHRIQNKAINTLEIS